MVGVLVNGDEVPLDYQLKDDDIVKIISDPNSKGPDESWLDIAITSKARRRMLQYIDNQQTNLK